MCLCKVWLSPLSIFLLHSDLISEYVCFEHQNHKKHCNGSIMTIHNQLKNIDFLFLYSNNKCLFSRKVMNNLNNPLAMPDTFPTKFTSRFLHPSIFADRKTLYFSVDKIIQEFMSKKSRWQLIYSENSDRNLWKFAKNFGKYVHVNCYLCIKSPVGCRISVGKGADCI